MTPENYYLINRIFFIIVVLTAIALSLWLFFIERRRKENQLFFLMGIFITIWITFGYFAHIGSDYSLALLWTKIAAASALFFLLTSFFFLKYFLVVEKISIVINSIILFLGLSIGGITIFTNLFFSGILSTEWGSLPQPGGMWGIYNIFAISMGIIIIFLSSKKYLRLSQGQRFKMQYFLVGFLIFLLMNIVFNTILPIFYQTYYLYQFGNYSTIIFLGLTAYAIIARELFGIRVILTQALVGVIAVLLLWQAIVAIPNWVEFAWKSAIFLIFLYFGYLLIQSVIREIQRRAELQKLYEEVDRLSRAKSEFISIASHQLRTPLTAIKGYISMLIEGTYGKLAGRTVPPMEKVYASNERLIKLVNDLLNVSRIESGTLRIDLEKTSLEKVISSVADELSIKANEKKLYLKWEKSPEPLPEVTVDPDKFRQVVLNIIDNCIKYTEEGGVAVKTEIKKPAKKWPQGSVLIEIKDTGEGMTKEELEKMFESFSRGKAGAKHWTAGTGLGLYIARKFTEIHGGRVWAESEGEGKGSTFYIELPVK